MRKKISSSILQLLTISSLLVFPMAAQSQTAKVEKEIKKEVKKATNEKDTRFYRGTSIGLEIAGMGSYFLGSDIFNTEVQVQSNLLNKYMPVVEIGLGKTDATSDDTDIHYKTSAPYFRIGMDYNFMHGKPHLPGMLLGGLRYGFSSFKYDVDGPTMTDPNFGGVIETPFSYTGEKCTAHWIEAVVGLKVKIFKGFCMGWSARYKKKFSLSKNENSEPWYVPGFGKNSSSSFNLSYHLIYNLPF